MRRRLAGASQGEKGKKRRKDTLSGVFALTILRRILRIGLPAGIQSAVFAISNIVIQSAINSLGTVVMAASSAAFNIEIITYDIRWCPPVISDW